MSTENYVEFRYAGLVATESVEILDSGVEGIEMPPRAFAYRTFEREVSRVIAEDGNPVVLRSDPRRVSPWTYVGESYTIADIKLLHRTNPSAWNTLLDNMGTNHWTRVVKTKFGQFWPLTGDDKVRAW